LIASAGPVVAAAARQREQDPECEWKTKSARVHG
jgi:hypothetical protein